MIRDPLNPIGHTDITEGGLSPGREFKRFEEVSRRKPPSVEAIQLIPMILAEPCSAKVFIDGMSG